MRRSLVAVLSAAAAALDDGRAGVNGTFLIEPPDIKRSLNLYRNDDRNEVVIPSASLK
jgi:hypothetical protein